MRRWSRHENWIGSSWLSFLTRGCRSPCDIPGHTRTLFTVKDCTFGIVICHEGWRYPETVRWAAEDAPYYEKAMICRSVENAIFFASVNYALPGQDSATSLISPEGRYLAYVPYGEEKLLVRDLDLSSATRMYTSRYQPDRYRDE